MGCFYDMKSGLGIWMSVCVCVGGIVWHMCTWVSGVVWSGRMVWLLVCLPVLAGKGVNTADLDWV